MIDYFNHTNWTNACAFTICSFKIQGNKCVVFHCASSFQSKNIFTETFYTLVNPNDYFSQQNIAVHGIQPDDVQNAPDFAFVYPHMLDFIGNLPVVAFILSCNTFISNAALCATTGKLPIKSNICG